MTVGVGGIMLWGYFLSVKIGKLEENLPEASKSLSLVSRSNCSRRMTLQKWVNAKCCWNGLKAWALLFTQHFQPIWQSSSHWPIRFIGNGGQWKTTQMGKCFTGKKSLNLSPWIYTPSNTTSKQFFAIERINTLIFRYFRAAPLSNISVLYATLLETCPKRPTA